MSVTHIAAGNEHSLAVRSDKSVWAWGGNNHGQLGDDSITMRTTPVEVKQEINKLPLTDAAHIAAGEEHTLAVLSDGTVRAWGKDDFGQLGDDPAPSDKHTAVPVFLP